MTAYRYCVICCDFDRPPRGPCGEESPPEPTVALARREAREMGWRRLNGQDYCPQHVVDGALRYVLHDEIGDVPVKDPLAPPIVSAADQKALRAAADRMRRRQPLDDLGIIDITIEQGIGPWPPR